MKHLSLIIPIYNSSKVLSRTLDELVHFFNKKQYLTEIIFVDDGSKDNSVMLVERFIVDYSSNFNIKIIKHKKNLGKGASIKDGISNASDDSDYIFFTDDDLPFGLLAMEKMFFIMCNNDRIDIIAGDRTLYNQPNPYPLFRNMGSYFFALLLPGKIIKKYPDTQCGLKGFKLPVAKKIFPLIKNSRWSFDVEIFLIATHSHFAIKKFPLLILEHVKASRFRAKDVFIVGKEIIMLWFYNLRGYY